jgi:hypothetical protein
MSALPIFETEPSPVQLIAKPAPSGWSFAPTVITCRGTADLHVVPRVEPKPAAFVIEPKREYVRFLSKHCRASYNAALVLSLLIFRCQRNRPGEQSARLEVIREGGRWGAKAFWWLHTREDIADECDISEDQVRTAVETLVKQGLVEVRAGRHPRNGEVPKYRGETVWHLRLGVCQRGCGLTGWPTVADLIQTRIILDGEQSPPIGGEQSPPLLPDTLKLLDTKEENLNIKSAPEKATGAAHVQNNLPKNASGKGKAKAMEEPSAEVMRAWGDFEEAYRTDYVAGCLIEYEENVSDYMVPGWPDSKRQALQRYEYAVTNHERLDPAAVLRALTPARWQAVQLDYDDIARANPLYLLKIYPLLCARYRAQLLKATKSNSHRAFNGVRAMRARVMSAVKKAVKQQQGNGWFKEQTGAEKAETAAQAGAAKKKAVQLAIEQYEKYEAMNAEGLANGDPMAVPEYGGVEAKKAQPPVEVVPAAEPPAPDTADDYSPYQPLPTPEQEAALIAARQQWFADRLAEKQQAAAKQAKKKYSAAA